MNRKRKKSLFLFIFDDKTKHQDFQKNFVLFSNSDRLKYVYYYDDDRKKVKI